MSTFAAQITINGLNALGALLQGLVTFVEIGTGAGTLSAGLTSGTPYTSLSLALGVPAAIPSGTVMTVLDATNAQSVTTSGTTAPGATTINVTSFTPTHTFAVGAGVVTTPAPSDLTLQAGVYRVAATFGTPGPANGEVYNPGYIDPGAPTNTYIEVGYFGGAGANAALGSGQLIARSICWYVAVNGSTSTNMTLDSTL